MEKFLHEADAKTGLNKQRLWAALERENEEEPAYSHDHLTLNKEEEGCIKASSTIAIPKNKRLART